MNVTTVPTTPRGGRTERMATAGVVWGWRALGVLVIAALWEWSRAPGGPAVGLLPGLSDIALQLVQLTVNPAAWSAIGATLAAALSGLTISGVLGVGIGLVLGLWPGVARATRLSMEVARAMPVFGLVPVCVLLLGTGFLFKIAIVVTACIWPFVVQTQAGTAGLHSQLAETVRAYRISRGLAIRRVMLPHALPMIGTALRISLSMSVVVTIGTETIVPSTGIGERIATAERSDALALMFAYVVVAAVLGLAANVLAVRAEHAVSGWRKIGGGA